ncbi:MAG: HNH endonuclease, partial [Deferrisomatales bacterium]
MTRHPDSDGLLSEYLRRLTRLRTDVNAGHYPDQPSHRAPHKPILLLSVMDLVAEGSVADNFIELSPDLVEVFSLYWSRVMPRDRRGIPVYPFFHLRSDGFWHLVPRPGKEEILQATTTVSSANRLRELVRGARLDEELFALLLDPESREVLRAAVLEQYFAPEVRPALLAQAQVNVQAYRYSLDLLDAARSEPFGGASLAAEALPPPARDQGFRRAVVTAYEHRCSFCGIRMTTPDGHTVVEAAHIVPWSESRNDDPRNGLALCRLCHWTFDEGLLGLSAVYVILASPQLTGNGNVPAHLG